MVEAAEKLQATSTSFPNDPNKLGVEARPHSTMVSFAEPTHDHSDLAVEFNAEQADNGEPTPLERSTGATSDMTDLTRALDTESTTTTALSLFGEEVPMGTLQTGS